MIKRTLSHLAVASALAFACHAAHAGAMTDYGENKNIDALLRGQTLGAPATGWWALGTNACSDSGSPAEPSGNGYARPSLTASLANWSGTLNSSQTVASTGTSGTSYNITAIPFATSTGAWASSAAGIMPNSLSKRFSSGA